MSQAGRNLSVASLAGIVAVCATLSVSDSAWAYDAKSSDENVLKSCKDFKIDASGVLSADCNEWDDGKVKSVEARTIDLDEKIGVKDGKLEYNGSNFSAECTGETANWNSSELKLVADCGGGLVGIRLDDRISNAGYGGAGGDPGLYWTDALGAAAQSAPVAEESSD